MIGQLFKSFGLGKAAPPTAPAKTQPKFEIPGSLPKISAPTAGPVLKAAGLSAPAEVAQGTPSQYLQHVLNEKPDGVGATQFLAHGMKPETGLQWATESAEAAGKLAPEDAKALAAAKAFQAQPTPIAREEARIAAQKSGYKGPGGWAALAAAAYPKPGDVTTANAVPPEIFPKAVAGAVSMASGAPAAGAAPASTAAAPQAVSTAAAAAPAASSAAENVAVLNALKPFLERGLQLASKA